jgi:hypothetical protein
MTMLFVILGFFWGCGENADPEETETETGMEIETETGTDVNCYFEVIFVAAGYSGRDWHEDMVITDDDTWQSYLTEFIPQSTTDSMSRTDIDFTTEQVAISTHYESSTCGMSFDSTKVCEEDDMITLYAVINNNSNECEEVCDAEGQVVFAVVTPVGETIAFDEEVVGGCE